MASPAVIGLALGVEDLAVDIGVSRTRGGLELLYARGQIVLAAAAAGLSAIDMPCTDIQQPAFAGREAVLARRLGFAGKLVIHPAHVPFVNAAFTPSPEEVEAARMVIAAFDAAKASGQGVVRVSGRMVDEPVATAARRIVARAERATRE